MKRNINEAIYQSALIDASVGGISGIAQRNEMKCERSNFSRLSALLIGRDKAVSCALYMYTACEDLRGAIFLTAPAAGLICAAAARAFRPIVRATVSDIIARKYLPRSRFSQVDFRYSPNWNWKLISSRAAKYCANVIPKEIQAA